MICCWTLIRGLSLAGLVYLSLDYCVQGTLRYVESALLLLAVNIPTRTLTALLLWFHSDKIRTGKSDGDLSF